MLIIILSAIMSTLTLKVVPAHCFEPCTIRYTITIAEVENVKDVCIWLDSEGFGRSSCWPPHARTIDTQVKDVPAGYYIAKAAIQRVGGAVEWSPEHHIQVLSNR